jgi:DNA transformation protein
METGGLDENGFVLSNSGMKNAYLEFIVEQFAPMGEITARAMMGGHVLYCDAVVFALLSSRNQLYLKTDDENRPAFEAAGLKPFRPFEDRKSVMPYYTAPPEIFEDADAMRTWVAGAVQAGIRSQAKKKKRSPKNI